jgi:peptide alpha-N-acetyltransferase
MACKICRLPRTNELSATGKYVLALKCLLASNAIDPAHPQLHRQIAKFRQTIDSLSEPLPPTISEIIAAEIESLLPKSKSLADWNDEFLAAHSDSPAHVRSVLAVRQSLAPESKPEVEKQLVSSLDLDMASIEDALAGMKLLNSWGSGQEVKTAYRDQARKRWKEASVFNMQQ